MDCGITSALSTVIAAEVVVSVMLTSAPPCISYYKQNKLNRLVHDDSRQLEWVGQQGRQLDQRRRDFHAHALGQEEPAACNTPLLPSRRHFSLVVRRFPHCLLQQQQSAINIKCATQVVLRVMKFILVSLICISC